MDKEVSKTLQAALSLWEKIKTSQSDEAGSEAEGFQLKFYEFVESVGHWVTRLEGLPGDADTASTDERFSELFMRLPEPLQIPFAMELDAILAGQKRDIDSTEQS